jgi:hypothetical protein
VYKCGNKDKLEQIYDTGQMEMQNYDDNQTSTTDWPQLMLPQTTLRCFNIATKVSMNTVLTGRWQHIQHPDSRLL